MDHIRGIFRMTHVGNAHTLFSKQKFRYAIFIIHDYYPICYPTTQGELQTAGYTSHGWFRGMLAAAMDPLVVPMLLSQSKFLRRSRHFKNKKAFSKQILYSTVDTSTVHTFDFYSPSSKASSQREIEGTATSDVQRRLSRNHPSTRWLI